MRPQEAMIYKAIHEHVPTAYPDCYPGASKIRNLKMHAAAGPMQEQARPAGESSGNQHAAPTHVPFGWEMGRLASLCVVLNT